MPWCCVLMREEPDSGSEPHSTRVAYGLGYVEGITHDYVHGITLFAALGNVTGAGLPRASLAIAIRSSSPSCVVWTLAFRPHSTSTW